MRYLKGVVEPTGRGLFWRQAVANGRMISHTEYATMKRLAESGRFAEACRIALGARAFSTGIEGLPDLGGIFDERAWMREIKLPGQRPDKHQEDMMNYLRKLGVDVDVAHSVREIEDSIIPRRRFDEEEYDYSTIPF